MIVFDIRCSRDHVFEAWFKDSATFEAQVKGGEVACPSCGDTSVEKAPMAPRLSTKASGGEGPSEKMVQFAQAMGELRRQVEENCDYVGDKFADEARKIHYGETDPHNIYGEATSEEAESLNEEGIEFQKIPWAPRHDA